MNNNNVKKINSIERGIVVNNYDPEFLGRVKVFVYGVYPEEFRTQANLLPWSEPVMSLFGGNYLNDRTISEPDLNIETGISTIPHTSEQIVENGAEVWVFFEAGDPNLPKHFAACQAGKNKGWLSQHKNQHVIKTDNVRIVVDEVPDDPQSTQQFTTYNNNCTQASIDNHTRENVPTRVDVEIWNKPGIALNLQIKGDVNVKVEGNVYEHIIGNKHETLEGNLYRKHIGDVHYVHEGDTVNDHTGDKADLQDGNLVKTISGTRDQMVGGYNSEIYSEDSNIQIMKDLDQFVDGNHSIEVSGYDMEKISGNKTQIVGNTLSVSTNKMFLSSMQDLIAKSVIGKMQLISILNTVTTSAVSIFNKTIGVIQNNASAIFFNQIPLQELPEMPPSEINISNSFNDALADSEAANQDTLNESEKIDQKIDLFEEDQIVS